MSASHKNLRALKIDEADARVELIGLIDHELDAEMQSARVQELVNKMILLGQKKGRPRREEEDHDEIAA